MNGTPYYHVDVFSDIPLSGNGLIVFPESGGLNAGAMLRLTREMRQFESIFLEKTGEKRYRARVFTVEEELDFAGHPVLGAAAVLHDLYEAGGGRTEEKQGAEDAVCEWVFELNAKTVKVVTRRGIDVRVQVRPGRYEARMNQGSAEFGKLLDDSETAEILSAMNLSGEDLYPGRRPMVVSTGLPYVIVPLEKNILKARICVSDMNERLERWNAKFIGVLEIPTLTMRTWDNAGTIEDIATGSLAGPCGAYLVRESMRQAGGIIELQQGGNLGRPSRLLAEVQGTDVYVGGSVCMIAQGRLHAEVF